MLEPIVVAVVVCAAIMPGTIRAQAPPGAAERTGRYRPIACPWPIYDSHSKRADQPQEAVCLVDTTSGEVFRVVPNDGGNPHFKWVREVAPR